jgi:hypothetical protein
MSSSYQYSFYYKIEYSHVDIPVIYKLEYSPYVMIISHLTRCFIIHIMFMNSFRLMLWWWFIMLSGTPKPFACRSVGSRTPRTTCELLDVATQYVTSKDTI